MVAKVISGDSARHNADLAGFMMVDTASLTPGIVLRHPVYDAANVLLLAAGVHITSAVIERLKQRGITYIMMHKSELARFRHQAAESRLPIKPSPSRPAVEADLILDASSGLSALPRSDTFLKTIARHGKLRYDEAHRRDVVAACETNVQHVNQAFESRDVLRSADVDGLEGITEQTLIGIAQDIDLFVSIGISPELDSYPARHSLQTAVLAMCVGANLGVEQSNLIKLGLGCLAHDAGMLHLDQQLLPSVGPLNRSSMLEITKHPQISFELLRNVDHILGAGRLVAYQMHERCNGTGYPRGRTDKQIHPLSKIAAVADVFTAMVSPRTHRPAVLPYVAMEYLLRGAKVRLFEPMAVRALLHTVSLFPIGSYVELSDGRVARVLRANGNTYTRPVVEAWENDVVEDAPNLLDLATESAVDVARPIPAPHFAHRAVKSLNP